MVRTQPLKMEVKSLLGDQPDLQAFREIKGAIASPQAEPKSRLMLPLLIAAATTLGLLIAGIHWTRRRRDRPPVEWALDEIKSIESRCHESSLSDRDAYAELSGVLRGFLEQRFGFPATAQSSGEIRQALADRSVPDAICANATRFLVEADEIRFSGRPRSSSNDNDKQQPANRVRELIQAIAADTTVPVQGE
jgi:hypothetical protein